MEARVLYENFERVGDPMRVPVVILESSEDLSPGGSVIVFRFQLGTAPGKNLGTVRVEASRLAQRFLRAMMSGLGAEVIVGATR